MRESRCCLLSMTSRLSRASGRWSRGSFRFAITANADGFGCLAHEICEIERAMGDGVKRVYDSEVPVMNKLRRVNAE